MVSLFPHKVAYKVKALLSRVGLEEVLLNEDSQIQYYSSAQ